jgi:hypothetical protein
MLTSATMTEVGDDQPRLTLDRLREDRNAHQRKVYAAKLEAETCTRCTEPATDGAYCAEHAEAIRKRDREYRAARDKALTAAGRCIRCKRRSDRYECVPCQLKLGRLPKSKLPPKTRPTLDQRATREVVEADGYTRTREVGQARRGAPSRATEDATSTRLALEAWQRFMVADAFAAGADVDAAQRAEAKAIADAWLHQAVGHSADRLRRAGFSTEYTDGKEEDVPRPRRPVFKPATGAKARGRLRAQGAKLGPRSKRGKMGGR